LAFLTGFFGAFAAALAGLAVLTLRTTCLSSDLLDVGDEPLSLEALTRRTTVEPSLLLSFFATCFLLQLKNQFTFRKLSSHIIQQLAISCQG
jgi:hypothetical protein